MDTDQPATKADIADVKQEIALVRGEAQHQYDDLKETLRDVQTEILKAFYGYAQTTDVKLKEGEVADIALGQRLTEVEGRVL